MLNSMAKGGPSGRQSTIGGKMKVIKLVQTWNPVAGRRQEYAVFITREFHPLMKDLGLEVVSGWYTLVGGGPSILVESTAGSLGQVEGALGDERCNDMLGRFMNLVTHYASRILESAAWMTMYHWRAACLQETREAKSWDDLRGQQEVKYAQSWDVRPGRQEEYQRFLQEVYLPQMEAIGLEVTAYYRLILGSGCQIFSEAHAPSLANVARALHDDRYMRLTMRLEELVTHYESRILVRHRYFLNTLHDIHGRAIRAIASDAMHSMIGPIDE